MDIPAGATQEEGQTGCLNLPSAGLSLIFLARRIELFLSLVDRINRFPLVGHFFLCVRKNPSSCDDT